jgi:hypothetical protein
MCHGTAEVSDSLRTEVQAEISERLAALAGFFDEESDSYIDPDALNTGDRDELAVARFNYQFVEGDASVGVHNSTFARRALDIAEGIVTDLSQ